MSLFFPHMGLTVRELVADSVVLLREFEPDGGYYGCFSGGKDSVVIKHLAAVAGVAVAWHYNVTTIDPPELVKFIRREHGDVKWNRPRAPFFQALIKRGFPTRRARWCCREYKESASPKGAVLLMGIRAEESPRRAAAWKEVTHHTQTETYCVLPILKWRETHIWDLIRTQRLPYCDLYDEGLRRLGCIGCPMADRQRRKQFERWPGYEKQWRRSFRLLWEQRQDENSTSLSDKWNSWQEMWDWWMSNDHYPSTEAQCQLDMWV